MLGNICTEPAVSILILHNHTTENVHYTVAVLMKEQNSELWVEDSATHP